VSKSARRFFLLFLVLLGVQAGPAFAQQATPASLDFDLSKFAPLAKALKLDSLKKIPTVPRAKKIKVAIIDNGFEGYERELGKGLPQDTVYHPGKGRTTADNRNEEPHGTLAGLLFYKVLQTVGVDSQVELHLFYAFGYDRLAEAIDEVTKGEFDLVVYAQTWHTLSNGDGKGFINALVDKATATGLVWINASGNNGGRTYSGPIRSERGRDGLDWVRLDKKVGRRDAIEIVCATPIKNQKCLLQLTLTWNDFKNSPDEGTDKDLDLILLDRNHKEVAASRRVQKLALAPGDDIKVVSRLPRELMGGIQVEPGTYYARIQVKSQNFDPSRDEFRLVADKLGIGMPHANAKETLFAPADNPNVIVVGGTDFPFSSKSPSRNLPQIFLPTTTEIYKGVALASTSHSAALAGGLAATFMAQGLGRDRAAVEKKLMDYSRSLSGARPPVARAGSLAGTAGSGSGGAAGAAAGAAGNATAGATAAPRTSAGGNSASTTAAPSLPSQAQQSRRSANRRCFEPVDHLPYDYAGVREFLEKLNGQLVWLNGRVAILIRYNDADVAEYNGLRLEFEDEFLFVTPQGMRVNSRLPNSYQVVSSRLPICGASSRD